MAFDTAEPQDSTKIRDLGTVIRPNWVAIEDGDNTFKPAAVNLNDRTVAGLAVDPTVIADAFISYCKTDAAGNSELFGLNDASDVLQMTKGAPTLAATGNIFLPGGLILSWGQTVMTTSPSATVTPAAITTVLKHFYAVIGNTADIIASEGAGAGFRFIRGSGTSSTTIQWLALGV